MKTIHPATTVIATPAPIPAIAAINTIHPTETIHAVQSLTAEIITNSVQSLTDSQLYDLCERYGLNARLWKQKFAGLLPEVFQRKLYEKKGFGSIFEFAAKLAGISQEQVSRVLSLHDNFLDKPALKKILENGEVSINKLARITSVATSENQKFWAEQVKILPNRALETLVRDEKLVGSALPQQNFGEQFVHVHKSQSKTRIAQTVQKYSLSQLQQLQQLQLSNEVLQKLLELQNKGMDINVLLLEFFEKRELEIAQEKERLSSETRMSEQQTRYIPANIKNLLKKEYGTKCSISTCTKPAAIIHHTQRFALAKIHDPKFLAPLCREHHIIAHHIDLKFLKFQKRAVADSIKSDSGSSKRTANP